MKSQYTRWIGIAASIVFIGFSAASVCAQTNAVPGNSSKYSSGASIDQPTDSQLDHAAKQALAKDPLTRNAHIGLETQDRMVTLSGHVESRAVAKRAEALVSNVNGIKGVEDELKYGNNQTQGARTSQ